MNAAQLIDDLLPVYNNAPKWKKRLESMDEGQLLAVWYKFKAVDFKRATKAVAVTEHHAYASYVCPDCGAMYTRDNPNLEECELCGSQDILKEVFR